MESTLVEGVDTTQNPDKELIEKERVAMKKLQPLLEKFVHERIELQVSKVFRSFRAQLFKSRLVLTHC